MRLRRSCWEYEIVAEEDIKAWNEDERAAAKLQVQNKDAQIIREKSLGFFECKLQPSHEPKCDCNGCPNLTLAPIALARAGARRIDGRYRPKCLLAVSCQT